MFQSLFGKKQQAPQTLPQVEVPLTDEQRIALAEVLAEADGQGMVRLGEITRLVFNQQVQYISYYYEGVGSAIVATDGLRVQDGISYHEYTIHKDDVLPFFGRILAHRGRI